MARRVKDGRTKELYIENVVVIMTMIGGFTKEHTLYAVNKENEVYKTYDFELKKLKVIVGEYIGKLKNVEIERFKPIKAVVLDAVEIKLYKAEDNKLKLYYSGYLAIGNKPKLVRDIQALDF